MTLLEAALVYAARGWPTFPCKKDKSPYTPHGFQDATTIILHIEAWWRQWPSASIGVPTGLPSTFDVLDLDGETGLDSMASLGIEPDGPRQKTQSGGLQVFYKPGTLSTSARKLPGLDTRGKGGYVIVPPSVGAKGAYEWILEPRPGVELPEPPAALREIMTSRVVGGAIEGEPVNVNDPGHQAILAMAGIPLRTICQGARNDVLFKTGASLRSRGSEGPAIRYLLGVINALLCSPPLGEKELNVIAGQAAKLAMSESYQRHAEVIRQATERSAKAQEAVSAATEKAAARAQKVAEKAAVVVTKATEQAEELLGTAAAEQTVSSAVSSGDLDVLRDLIADHTGVRIERVIQVGRDAPHYVLDLGEGEEVPVGHSILYQERLAEKILHARQHTGFADLSSKRWPAIRQALAALVVVKNDVELTRAGQTIVWIRDYYQNERPRSNMKRDVENVSARRPFIEEGWLYVSARGLQSYLGRAGIGMTFQEVGQRLAEVCERKGSGVVTVSTAGGPEQVRYWRIELTQLFSDVSKF